jgi:hypothetical protein
MGSAASKPTEQVLPTSNPPSPTTTFPLQQVGVRNPNANSAPPPSVVPTIQSATPNQVVVKPRRGEYVALGGSRKKSKAKKSRKGKAKKTKSRK